MQINSTTEESNAWARLRGLVAVLSLPAHRCDDGIFRKRKVEVELDANTWVAVDSMAIESERIVFWFGTNGTRVEYVFPRDACPRWRVEPSTPQRFEYE